MTRPTTRWAAVECDWCGHQSRILTDEPDVDTDLCWSIAETCCECPNPSPVIVLSEAAP